MKTIHINRQIGVKFILFPDNQPHVNVTNIVEGDEVKVICSIYDSLTLIHLLQCSNALDTLFAKKKILVIPYLMGARFDRIMNSGDSFDLKIIAELINNCGFEKVYLYDVHSDVALALINNSINIPNDLLVSSYKGNNSLLICPDAGAAKKIGKYLKLNDTITDIVYCVKNRNLATGDISLKVLEPDKCLNRNCVIIDDLCDGGGTFMAIASQINPSKLSLIVTHGIFSKGTKLFENKFDEIITSDSYASIRESKIVKTIPFNV